LTAGQVFGNENGHLGAEVRDEVICRNEARKEKEFAVLSRKIMNLQELISHVKVMKDKMNGNNFKLTTNKLRLLVTYKKTKEDTAIPSGKATLLTLKNETKHCLSPRCSSNNSNNEDEEEVEDKERNSIIFEEMGTTEVVFGHDDSDNEFEE
jgi:ribosomal protein S15P/S13E